MKLPVYLDYAATTPVDPKVAETMMGAMTLEGNFANPASRSHRYGWFAEESVESARQQVAELIGADPREIVWTSGATESDNLAIKGVAEALRQKGKSGKHIVTSAIEHKAVLDTCEYLEQAGYEVTYLKPDTKGLISASQVKEALTDDTILVSIMMVNNELGTINPIAEIGELCKQQDVLFHTDAAQAVGKIPFNVDELNVDMASISAHKMYGPKGIGCLYVRRKAEEKFAYVASQIHGGGHERGMRSGTLPTHQIVGFGKAAEIAKQDLADETIRLTALREKLWQGVQELDGVTLNGDPENRIPGIVNISFNGVDGETLLLSLHQIAVSTGSACASATMEPSYVLTALGLPADLAHASVRFSLGRFTTDEEIEFAVNHIKEAVSLLRS